jgi:hypothetical protein
VNARYNESTQGNKPMTYYAIAMTNNKAQLVVHRMETTDQHAVIAVAAMWEAKGYVVKQWTEA